MLQKMKSHAFKKDCYLVGINEYGESVWLESPSWDCSWYWGFGYMETYTSKNPATAKDINSHEHYSGFTGFTADNGKYIYHVNESPKFKETVLTDRESWELADLMKQFYTMREAAEVFHRGSANYTMVSNCDTKNLDIEKYINEITLPKIFKRVIEILSPEGN